MPAWLVSPVEDSASRVGDHASQDIAELCHLWLVLSGFALDRVPRAGVSRLVDRQAAWQSRQTLRGRVAEHRAWHRELAALSGNQPLAVAVEHTLLQLAPYVVDARLAQCWSVDPLLDALLLDDVLGAQRQLREHVADFERILLAPSAVTLTGVAHASSVAGLR